MLKRLPSESVTLRRANGCGALLVESGDASYSIPALERKGFPHTEVAFPDDAVKVSGVPSMVRHSTFAVSARNQNPLLKCINLKFTRDGLVAVGSDGIRLVSTKGDSKSTGDIALLVPAASLNTLARLCSDKDEFHVGTTDKSIVFRKPNLTFTARIVEEEYVDTDRIISSLSNAFTVLTDVAELKRALSCVAAATNADGRVRMSFDGMKLTLFATGAYGAALAAAKERAEETRDILAAWSDEPGDLTRCPINTELLRRVRQSESLVDISRYLGRFREIFAQGRKNGYAYGRGEKYSLELGNDMSKALTSELAMLSTPMATPLFLQKYRTKQIKQYRRREPVFKGMGDIICCLDESASTSGESAA